MRVLHLFKTYWPDTFGGVERTIHAIAKGTARYGVQSSVLSLSSTPETSTVQFDGHMAYKSKLDFEFASTGISRDVFGLFRQLSAQADVIHYHFPWPLADLVHFFVRAHKPAILTYHSDIIKQKHLLRLYRPLMHRFLGAMDAIVATSPSYAKTSDVLRRHATRTTIIPIGLEEKDYPPVSTKNKETWRQRFPRPFFLFVGVLRYYKGLHILLEAATNQNFDVVVVGDGPMREDLLARAEKLGARNVHFLGFVDDTAKSALLELSTGLVFPSHMRSEAFGLSLVEAAMFGKPMISTELGTGTSYVNIDGETGLVVKPNDSGELSRALVRLAEDQELVGLLGANARQRFEMNFTAEMMCRSYADLYGRVLAENADLSP
ncbi:MAG: glycosyltransferase [Agrobacterium sp.]|nr:glycosyltransferase [Agrobacterium sp.]